MYLELDVFCVSIRSTCWLVGQSVEKILTTLLAWHGILDQGLSIDLCQLSQAKHLAMTALSHMRSSETQLHCHLLPGEASNHLS